MIKFLITIVILINIPLVKTTSELFSITRTKQDGSIFNYEEEEIDFKKLKNLQINETSFSIIHFRNPKISNFTWYDNVELYVNQISKKYFIYYTASFKEGHDLKFLRVNKFICNIRQCDIGWFLVFKNETKGIMEGKDGVYHADYAILFVITSKDNHINLKTIEINNELMRLSICPYVNWVSKKGIIKFVPEDNIKDNGYFVKANDYAHIITPIFFIKVSESSFFICGKLKQPTKPDLNIGYKLKKSKVTVSFQNISDVVDYKIKCYDGEDSNDYYHFGYTPASEYYMNKNVVDKIDYGKNFKFYAGQIINIYKTKPFKKCLENANSETRLEDENVYENPRCSKRLPNKLNVTIFPVVDSLKFITYNKKNKVFLQYIEKKDMNKVSILKCLSKVDNEHIPHLDEFYSRYVHFSIIHDENNKVKQLPYSFEFNFSSSGMSYFGKYDCEIKSNVAKFDKKLVTVNKVFILPYNHTDVPLKEILVGKNGKVSCQKKYGSFSKLLRIKINFLEDDKEMETLSDFSKSTNKMHVTNKEIEYHLQDILNDFEIQCIYETIFETKFSTIQKIKILNENDSLSNKLFIIIIVSIVSGMVIIIVLIVTILIRRKRRINRQKIRRMMDLSINSSLSSSTSSVSTSSIKSRSLANSSQTNSNSGSKNSSTTQPPKTKKNTKTTNGNLGKGR
ncbi:Hypothetical protein SRAE_2000132600 [Strongyloides ratti]|uniref:Uncharacterized protein n=1 Tax=Strongyloides ratti TaxID=34506 RepID=A0A090LET7_STRRB|nr:Hypothetical protein SRAE_2000132600 [Strongyloides ratti]CEF66658.1 Hypothetical protein SRAE_2000132600 [Strongyloides ratti]